VQRNPSHYPAEPASDGFQGVRWPDPADNRELTNFHSLTGDFRMHRAFRSKILDRERDVLVYLPPGYEESDRRYPVLYLQDGQNVFDGATSFIEGKEWRADETAQGLILAGTIEPLIMVAIYNAGHDRLDEYTPTRDLLIGKGGEANLYYQMLVEELMPVINKCYRTRLGPENTALGGSSMGGLLSLHLGLAHPELFGKVAALSPSVWWDKRALLRQVNELVERPPVRIWLDIGTEEGRIAIRQVRQLRNGLLVKGWRLDLDLVYFEAKGGVHDENAWAERVAPCLSFLFPGE
jgi:predicted alpha/beta superfamily hydrolase